MTDGADVATRVRFAHMQLRSPLRQVLRRLAFAGIVLVVTIVVVYVGRAGYQDTTGNGLSLLDAAYYATVSLSTTGYGDVTPVSPGARLVNILVVTPLRVLFLLILIGTTLEALTARSREAHRIWRWRSHVRDHVIVCGYGTKGRSAVRALRAAENAPGESPRDVVVVDPSDRVVAEANADGVTGVVGDAGRADVLRRAMVDRARAVIVAVDRDDAAIMIALTVRQVNPAVRIIASVREEENASLLRQSGADTVITSSATSGRLLGMSTDSPRVIAVVEDLLTSGEGLELAQRPVLPEEVGRRPHELTDVVLAVERDGRLLRFSDPALAGVLSGDTLVVVRSNA